MAVGRVGRPHGVRGEVTVLLEGDHPGDFESGSILRAGERELEVCSSRPLRDRGLIVGFAGVTDRNAAEALRGVVLTGDAADRRSLEEGEFWSSDLVGLEAVTPAGAVLGRVAEVVTGGFQDRLVVTTPSGDAVQVPFVAEIVGDPEDGRILIDPPEGLFPG
ncbi:MAG: ribosome maturation factor RimM [Actinomycetota bacterium]